MALVLGDNFSYQGNKPLDARLNYNTVADMKAVGDATMYDGCTAYCKEADKTYQWKSTNTVDPTTGKWREFNSGGGGGSYTAGDGIDITNDIISTKQSEEGDIDEIIDVYPQAGNLVSIVNAFNRGDIYSTDEKMIGQWYDGKPLYQKTLTGIISVDTDKTSKTTTLGNVSEDLDVVASIDGIRQHDGKSVFVSLNASAGASNAVYVCNLFVNSGTGNLVVEDNRLADNGRTILATVKYTKASDTAISIGSTTEYSTDEKAVGTWIDGKTLYQKTLVSTMPTLTTDFEVAHKEIPISSLNVDTMVSMSGMFNNGIIYIDIGTFNGVLTSGLTVGISSVWYNKGDAQIHLEHNRNVWSDRNCYIIIQYTKTTT